MSSVRRLTAILAADVAGYSRLMRADEEGTLRRLQAHLRELIDPKITEHRGRVVKNTGDGFLAEFASVVDAVRCAVEVQRGMAERNATTSPEERIEFRVGINLGDVIAEGEDIFGDGVNVAARLEALTEPGGICVARVMRDQVREGSGIFGVWDQPIDRPALDLVGRPRSLISRRLSRAGARAPREGVGHPDLALSVLTDGLFHYPSNDR
jgi:class 3 adenylate cyclase